MCMTGECQGLAEELEEARKAIAEAERERDEAAARGDELASQLADMTAARDALAYGLDPERSLYLLGCRFVTCVHGLARTTNTSAWHDANLQIHAR